MPTTPIPIDHGQRVRIDPSELPWTPSAQPGLAWRVLEGGVAADEATEAGRVTAIVRCQAGAGRDVQARPRGEEIFVLEGIFEDENGVYPAGTYLKIPPGHAHRPFSRVGCRLFVKRGYLQAEDRQPIVVDSNAATWRPGLVDGLQVLPLSEFGTEHTALVRWRPGTRFQPHRHWGGEEILVLDGVFQDEFGDYGQGVWLRSPHMSAHQPFSELGCTILVKVGHLDLPPSPAMS